MIRSRFPAIRKATSLTREQQDTQNHANAILSGLQGVPFLDGVLVYGVVLSTNPTTVAHPLGRAPRGIPFVISASGPVAICDDPTKRTPTTVSLIATQSATCALWFY